MEDAGDKDADLGCRCNPTPNLSALAPDRGAALTWTEPWAMRVSVTPPPASRSGSCLSEAHWQQAHPLPGVHSGPWFLDAVLKYPSRKCSRGIAHQQAHQYSWDLPKITHTGGNGPCRFGAELWKRPALKTRWWWTIWIWNQMDISCEGGDKPTFIMGSHLVFCGIRLWEPFLLSAFLRDTVHSINSFCPSDFYTCSCLKESITAFYNNT